MAATGSSSQPDRRLVFLGSSGAIQVPSFHCTCHVCEAARANPPHRRTRASVALIGRETTLIDASPDMELQLERESIRQVHRIFLTHWHFDHVAGLGALAEPAQHAQWSPIEIYVPAASAFHFDQELAYLRKWINLHPIAPGDCIALPDATWEVVKTTHTADSVGFIVRTPAKRFAYLVDSFTPPPETMARLTNVSLVILEGTFDELDEPWQLFTIHGAIECWRQTGAAECVLTHLSCHGWRNRRLVAGLPHEQRLALEQAMPGVRFAFDGMVLAV